MKVSRLRRVMGGSARQEPLLAPETASALERSADLYLTARTMVEGLYQGRHQTRQRGASTEFFDFRAYSPGDPAQRVDWKVFGRTDRLYVRRFRHTSQMTVMLIVDRSASMAFAGVRAEAPTKYRRACELGAALAFLSVRQSDRVGLVLCGGGEDARVIAPGTGRNALHAVISGLESSAPEAHGVDSPGALATGIDAAARLLSRRSLIVALSDALDDADSTLGAAARARFGGGLAQGHDLALIQTLAPDELDISTIGGARLVDPENGQSVRTLGRAIAAKYREALEDHLRRLREGFSGMGARAMVAMTDRPAIESLRSFLSAE